METKEETMINIKDLFIVNYCHPSCVPLQNIMRLPKEEAFKKAAELARKNPDTTAFYRFADFTNYYPLRLQTDKIIRDAFMKLGGKPKEEHPLSFVLQGSDYLKQWFANGSEIRLPLIDIPEEEISFTYGDSGAAIEKRGSVTLITKKQLLDEILSFDGTLTEYMQTIDSTCHYIEVQLWNDAVISKLRTGN